MNIINLTPHAIVVDTNDKITTFPASGNVARVTTTQSNHSVVCGIPVVKTIYGDVDFGCEINSDDCYIV